MVLKEVKVIITEEKQLYVPQRFQYMKRSHQKRYLIWKTLACFRLAQYWKAQSQNKHIGPLQQLYAKLAYRHYFRQRNLYGEKSGVEIANHSVLGRRLNIWHGSVVISGQLGDDCEIHGNNIIGNKGGTDKKTPVLGNRVDMGVGAVIIGGIRIADGCRIGANAVVNKDFLQPNSLIVGIPACTKGK